MAASEKRSISEAEWEEELKQAEPSKATMDKILLEYFISEGFCDIAEKFIEESGTSRLECDRAAAEKRTEVMNSHFPPYIKIRTSIHQGNIQAAIEAVNDVNPDILDKDTALFFRLNIQRLIEIIRSGNIPEALEFARSELASLGMENPSLLDSLEEVMGLLAFPDRSKFVSSCFFLFLRCPSSHLLEPFQQHCIASLLNSAILESSVRRALFFLLMKQGQPTTCCLIQFLQLFVWVQTQLSSRVVFPSMSPLGQFEPKPST
jgi:hypothetical protein